METRQVTQVKIYKLILNPMRGHTEDASMVAISYEEQKLIDWYNEQVDNEGYVDEGTPSFDCHGDSHKWHKTFKKGSELEWFNPIGEWEPNRHGHGISEEWIPEGVADKCGVTLIQ